MKITGQSVKFIASTYMVCSFSKPLIYGFGRNAHDQFINPLTRPLLIALQVVRTSFEFHLRECMGSRSPLLPLLRTVISFLQIILYRIKTKVSYFMLFSAFGFAIVCSRYNDEDTRIYLCKTTNHLFWRVGRKKVSVSSWFSETHLPV